MTKELDEACAKEMGLYVIPKERHPELGMRADNWYTIEGVHFVGHSPPSYSTDPATTPLLLAEIERRGLIERYMHYLGTMETSAAYEDDRDAYGWELIRATPEQHAR